MLHTCTRCSRGEPAERESGDKARLIAELVSIARGVCLALSFRQTWLGHLTSLLSAPRRGAPTPLAATSDTPRPRAPASAGESARREAPEAAGSVAHHPRRRPRARTHPTAIR